jgi:dephospho-CoA kinase
MTRKRVIGLLGGIGSGKSRAAEAFARAGARVIAGDELAHEALRRPEVREQVVRRWGAQLLDEHGEVNRRELGGIVFADPEELKALEAMTHPWIRRRIEEEVAKAQADPGVPLVVLDAAVMLEAGWHGVCDELVFVDAPDEVRRRRVARGRGWTPEEARARESAQLPLTEKRARADHVLDNSAAPEHLDRQVDRLLRRWGVVPPAAQRSGPHPGALPRAPQRSLEDPSTPV